MTAADVLRKILRAMTSLNELDAREKLRVQNYLVAELQDSDEPTREG